MNARSTTPTAVDDPAISLGNFTVAKNGRVICRVADLQLRPGEHIGIEDLNGSGKTTLLRVLSGLERDFTGTCRIDIPPRERVFVHQSPYLFRGSVLRNVMYGLAARSMKRAASRRLAHEIMYQLGISELADRNVDRLSGGECRRVAIARACVLRPQLLLLDEPLSDLDEFGVECVRKTLAGLSNSTVVMTSPIPLPDGLITRTTKVSGCDG
ncbi:MAG: ATP-binding cassette domain-containing protein [Planctomycetota bacterium]|nr:ATP-binding cassette domain-containing protein [Planctomycetota bacterium]